MWSGTYGDGDAVIVEDETGVGASKLAGRHGDNASDEKSSEEICEGRRCSGDEERGHQKSFPRFVNWFKGL